MTEKERKIFQDFYKVYDKYRDRVLESDDDWKEFVTEVCALGVKHGWETDPLANHMAMCILDTFNDMYKDHQQPAPVGFFDRGDL